MSYVFTWFYRKVLDGISSNASTELQIVRLLAVSLTLPFDGSESGKKAETLMGVNELLGDPNFVGNNTLKVIGSQVFLHFGDLAEALKALFSPSSEDSGSSDSLEVLSMRIHILLLHRRVDLARAELKKMQQKDEDSSLTQLCSAWVNLKLGGKYYQEAVYIYQELLDKSSALSDDETFESSTVLMTGLAVAHMKMGNFEEGMRVIQRGLKRNGVKVSEGNIDWGTINAKKPGNIDLLVNLVSCSQQMRKTGLVEQCLQKLTQMFKQEKTVMHPFKQVLEKLNYLSASA